MTPSGLSQMLQRRGEKAGTDVRAHAFRRYYSTEWLAKGGSEVGLMRNNGWQGTEMVARYSKDHAEQLAYDEAKRLMES